MFKEINCCRVCYSTNIDPILSLGDLAVSDFMDNPSCEGLVAPLELVLCNKAEGGCGLLQLKHTVSDEAMFRNYWYLSGINQAMTDELSDITRSVCEVASIDAKDYVVDIGSNDGTLLRSYQIEGLNTVGFEPARNLEKYGSQGTSKIIVDFFSYDSWVDTFGDKKAKIITAIGMFYDLEDPSKFIADAAEALEHDGVFIAQLMCLNSMLKKNDLGNICHEHLEFYSYESLKYLFEKNGFKIFKVEENNINGGSYRIYCKKNIKKSIIHKENIGIKEIKKFFSRVKENKHKFNKFVIKAKKEKKKIFLYGASTKGNTLLQYYDINSKIIPFAAERSPEKWGKYTIGTGVKIISEKEARKLNPDYFFVMPYAFINEFKKRESKWLKTGGKFLLPYPSFRVVK